MQFCCINIYQTQITSEYSNIFLIKNWRHFSVPIFLLMRIYYKVLHYLFQDTGFGIFSDSFSLFVFFLINVYPWTYWLMCFLKDYNTKRNNKRQLKIFFVDEKENYERKWAEKFVCYLDVIHLRQRLISFLCENYLF